MFFRALYLLPGLYRRTGRLSIREREKRIKKSVPVEPDDKGSRDSLVDNYD